MADQAAGGAVGDASLRQLASYRKHVVRMDAAWPTFAARRRERLAQGGLFGPAVEKIAENILEDLFTTVLDWPIANVKPQVERADIVLTRLGLKCLVVEVKRPGALLGHQAAINAALEQVRRYAADQRVRAVAVSDATMLYAADVIGGNLRPRAWLRLDTEQPPEDLWWLSVHGIYRLCPERVVELGTLPDRDGVGNLGGDISAAGEVHPKYQLPMQCFAYVGVANDTHTWKLPYLVADGITPDVRRLPKAIQCILSNYRGAQVDIPEADVGDVMVRLGIAATMLGKMPCQNKSVASAYREAHRSLEQLGRLDEIGCTGDQCSERQKL